MGKTIEIRLSDSQFAALSAEVEAAGAKFFDYCRAKLIKPDGSGSEPAAAVEVARQKPQPAVAVAMAVKVARQKPQPAVAVAMAVKEPRSEPQVTRLDRLEALMAQVLDRLSTDQMRPVDDQDDEPQPTGTRDDFDVIMARRLSEADAQGLTRPQAAAPVEMTEDERDYEMVGVRPFRKPGPPSFSANGRSPPIIRDRV